MQVSQTSGTSASQGTSNSSSSSSASKSTVDYDSFLKILIAQMKNQDPTNPSDPSQFVSQLASFSSVEQQLNTNAKLDALMTSQALSQAGNVIGRTVTSEDGKISGEVASVKIVSGGAVATLTNGSELTLGAGVVVS